MRALSHDQVEEEEELSTHRIPLSPLFSVLSLSQPIAASKEVSELLFVLDRKWSSDHGGTGRTAARFRALATAEPQNGEGDFLRTWSRKPRPQEQEKVLCVAQLPTVRNSFFPRCIPTFFPPQYSLRGTMLDLRRTVREKTRALDISQKQKS